MENATEQTKRTHLLQVILIGRNPRWTIIRIVILVATVFLARAYVILPIKVKGPSMLPTYQESGLNFVNRLAYIHSPPRRGDVVAIRYAGPRVMLMKRIIALPGETVGFQGGHVFINGKLLDEPYIKKPCDWEIQPVKLAPDQYYVVGDNREMPEQNHMKGEATEDRIIGKVMLCKNLFASWLSSH